MNLGEFASRFGDAVDNGIDQIFFPSENSSLGYVRKKHGGRHTKMLDAIDEMVGAEAMFASRVLEKSLGLDNTDVVEPRSELISAYVKSGIVANEQEAAAFADALEQGALAKARQIKLAEEQTRTAAKA